MNIIFHKGAEFVLTVSRACDVSDSQLAAYGVAAFRYRYEIDGETYLDMLEYESDYDCLSSKMLSGKYLSLIPPTQSDYELFFESILDRGVRKIVHIVPKWLLTEDYNYAMKAARLEMVKYPKCEVYVVDSGTFSNGIDILVREGIRLRDEGVSAADAAVALLAYSKRIVTYFLPADPTSPQVAPHFSTPPTGSLLDLRQLCIINTRGAITIKKKLRGDAMVSSALSKRVRKGGGSEAVVSYGLDPTLALKFKRRLSEVAPDIKFTLGRTGAFTDWMLGGESLVMSYVASPDASDDDDEE